MNMYKLMHDSLYEKHIFSLIAKFPQKLWIFMKNVSDNFNAEFYVLSENAMKNTTFHLKKQS